MRLIVFFSWLAMALAFAAPSVEERILAAREGMEAKKPAEAARHLEALVEEGFRSPALFQNLAAAHLANEQPSRALLNLRRSLLLDGSARPAFLKTAKELDISEAEAEKWLASAAARRWTQPLLLAGSIFFWCGLASALVARMSWLRGVAIGGSAVGFLLLACGVTAWRLSPSSADAQVVGNGSVTVLAAPEKSAPSVGAVSPGEIVKILKSLDSWRYVRAGKFTGWMGAGDLERLGTSQSQ